MTRRGQHPAGADRRARAAPSDYWRAPRGDRGVQREQPGPQARPGADAGQVRHLLHRHASEPGRRARPRLHRRQRPSEPRRHRDGPGPHDQGRAGGGRRSSRSISTGSGSPPTTTGKVPNTSATAASSGTDLNGMAAQAAARTIKERLIAFARKRISGVPREAVVVLPERGPDRRRQILSFAELVKPAYLAPRAAVGHRLLPHAQDPLRPASGHAAGRSTTSPMARRCPRWWSTR